MSAPAFANAAFLFAHALLDELARAGVAHVCVCPGSRSAPLAVAAAATPGLRAWTHVDERSAGFFALGLARATRAPVALVCTSGTAAANFAPAVAEAFTARVPLVLLTADRPAELRDWGAGQTIHQLGIYGAHLRWCAETPIPEARGAILRHARALAARAAASASGPPAGPVHVNLPFREPLHPQAVVGEDLAELARLDPAAVHGRAGRPYTEICPAGRAPTAEHAERLARRLRSARGVVVCGPWDPEPADAEAVLRLARAAGWPVLADALSNLRSGPHTKEAPLLVGFDAWLRDEALAAALAPECVLRLGDVPTSKALRGWLDRHAAEEILLDPDGIWHDPSFLASAVVRADPGALCAATAPLLERAGASAAPSPWLSAWLRAESSARDAVEAALQTEGALFEPRVVREIAEQLPDGGTLFVSNSMPVRDADGFLPVRERPLRVLGNRGANGIDGIPSTALGAVAGGAAPLVLLTGDLALLHDVGGLLAARRHGLCAAIVVIRNGGGGIFDYLPIARLGNAVAYREHFVVPHDVDLRDAARLFGLGYERATSASELAASLAAALRARRATLLDVPVAREASVAHHRALWAAAGAAARAAVLPPRAGALEEVA